MQYAGAVGVMVLDKMSKSEDKLEEVEHGLAQVENASATNDDVQGVEMTLGVEIHAVEGSLEEAKRVWGESIAAQDQEWQNEKLAFTAVFLAMQQLIEGLQNTVASLQQNIWTLQDREIERELGVIHHVGNPIVIEDVGDLGSLVETVVETMYEDAREYQVVTKLIEIVD
jgi:hypothetical protein